MYQLLIFDGNLLIDYCRYLLKNSLLYVGLELNMIHIMIAFVNF